MLEGYSICFNEWALDKEIKDELGLLLIISSLTAQEGYCFASNTYLADLFKIDKVSISRKLKKLEDKKYITIEYLKKGSLIVGRKIRLTKMLTAVNKNVNGTVNKNVKDNNISINNININNKGRNFTKREYEDLNIYFSNWGGKQMTDEEIKSFFLRNTHSNISYDENDRVLELSYEGLQDFFNVIDIVLTK